MADISIELREAAPELEGGPTFSAFLKDGIIDGVVGETNLGRIEAFGIVDKLDVETRILLELAQVGGSYDGKELRQHNLGEFILPIVRVASDLEAGEQVAVRAVSKNATWEERTVYAIESEPHIPDTHLDELEETEMDSRGRILIGTDTSFEYRIKPNWPGLLPLKLARKFEKENRDLEKNSNGVRLTSMVSFFFRASFFDFEFEKDEKFRNQCYSGLRHYQQSVPKRPMS
jgi:hypothetical protein